LASFAYLGPTWNDQLRDAYLSGAANQTLKAKGLLALFSTGLNDKGPLQRLVHCCVTGAMYRRSPASRPRAGAF
jgi:hypothetical protein